MDDLFKNTAYKILELFINNSYEEYSIRSIARNINVSHVTILNHIKNLEKNNLILKKKSVYPLWVANTVSEEFKYYKTEYGVHLIKKNGLVNFLIKTLSPSSIILFGSFSKGTFNNDSDIDLFLECREQQLDLSSFESGLNRKINVFFEESINNLSKELKNNIINGVKLYGFLRIDNGDEF